MSAVKFYNGIRSPQIQFGTFRIKTEEDVFNSVTTALNAGYRAFDTASVYRNHGKIAKTFKQVLPKLNLTRKDIFITSKLAPKDHGTEKSEAAIKNILNDLDVDYLDLFLIHWPGVQRLDVTDPLNRELRQESWRVLEKFYNLGKFKAIGISNYTLSHMQELLSHCQIVPHVIQLELHPHYQQTELVQYCQQNKIHVQAYSSLGQAGTESPLYQEDIIKNIAELLSVTPAQVLLRWGVQKGYTIMPKSVTPGRIKENIDINHFKLSIEQMNLIDSLEKGQKYTWNPETIL